MRLDRQRKLGGALSQLVGDDLEVRKKRDLLLVLARVVERAQLTRVAHMTVAPPSTAIACPVMWREASEASSTTRPFRSSSLPTRPVGVVSRMSCMSLPSVALVILEGKNPGQMAFTVMPCAPHSAASWRVRPTRPCLVAL